MLWYKGWLETRFRLLFVTGYTIFLLLFQHSVRNATPPPGGKNPALGFVMFSNPTLVLMACALLGGAGIVTQPSLQATKGLHGSTLARTPLHACKQAPLVRGPCRYWMAGSGVRNCGALLRNVACIACIQDAGNADGDDRICGNAYRLCLGPLLLLCVAGYFSR